MTLSLVYSNQLVMEIPDVGPPGRIRVCPEKKNVDTSNAVKQPVV